MDAGRQAGGRGTCPRIQLALDRVALSDALTLVSSLGGDLARVEAGTPLLLRSGLEAVRRLRAALPNALIVADTKVCDAGRAMAEDAFDAGADIVTVVGVAVDSTTWQGVLDAASQAPTTGRTRRVVVDTLGVDRPQGALDWMLDRAGAVPVEVCVHRPRGEDITLAELADRFEVGEGRADYQIAGALTAPEIGPALAAGFSSVVVGSAITADSRPAAAWQTILDAASET